LPIAPVVPEKKLKAGQVDDNKNNSTLPPGLPPGAPSGGSPRGGVKLPGMGGGLPGMGGQMGGMGGVRKQHGYGIDPEAVTINGMRGLVANITAYAALHLVLSLADVPLNCAIDEHGVFIFPPAEPFRFLDGNKPKFSRAGRWVETGSSE
jgi:hypothetical protein